MYSTVNRKSISSEGRELSRSLRESLAVDITPDCKSGWVLRSSLDSANTTVEYVIDGDPRYVRFTIKLVPCICFRGCQTVRVAVNGGGVFIPFLERLKLRKAVRMLVLNYANRVADETIGN